MGVIHKKSRTTGKRPRRTGEKVAQNTGIDFLALRLGVVLSLPTLSRCPEPCFYSPVVRSGKVTRSSLKGVLLGARLRGRTATQRSKNRVLRRVLGRVLGKGFSEGF